MRFAALYLAGIIILVFILQGIFGTEALILEKSLKFQEPWRLVTAVFAHANAGHLLSNLFGLIVFGLVLEGRIGPKRVLWLFLLSGVIINIFSPYERSLGASGAVYGILGALVALRPFMVIWLNGLPMPMILAGLLWLAQDAIGVFVPDGIANIAHITGLILGLGMGIYWRRWFKDAKEKQQYDPGLERQLDEWEKQFMG